MNVYEVQALSQEICNYIDEKYHGDEYLEELKKKIWGINYKNE